MPNGGFGNLIALPLQKIPRKSGYSVFLDDSLEPVPDQWRYLAGVPRMEPLTVERIVRGAEKTGNVVGVRMSLVDERFAEDPWLLPPSRRRPGKPILGPLPATVRIVRANLLFIDKTVLPEPMLDPLTRLAAFQNPEFIRHKLCGCRPSTSHGSSAVRKNSLNSSPCREGSSMKCCYYSGNSECRQVQDGRP